MSKIIAIHQPNYLPWLGYFYKIYASDIFVFHDNVEYSKGSLTKRCQIRKAKGSTEKTYLSIPLQKQPDHTLIKDLLIDHKQPWVKKQLNQIRNTYAKAPYFDLIFPKLVLWLEEVNRMDKLADGNIYLIKQILLLIGIHRSTFRSSELPVSGYKSDYNLNIAAHLGAKVYLSGSGARKYQHDATFQKKEIKLRYHQFLDFHKTRAYTQEQGGYLYGLSMLDGLFNLGEEGCIKLFKQCDDTL